MPKVYRNVSGAFGRVRSTVHAAGIRSEAFSKACDTLCPETRGMGPRLFHVTKAIISLPLRCCQGATSRPPLKTPVLPIHPFLRCKAPSPPYCPASLHPLNTANDLLLPPTLNHASNNNHWFLELYSAARRIQFTNEHDLRLVQECLKEAKAVGVIETVEAALGDAVVCQQVKEEIRTLHRAGIRICLRVLEIEGRMKRLEESFRSYRMTQSTSQLVGIALQLIPDMWGSGGWCGIRWRGDC